MPFLPIRSTCCLAGGILALAFAAPLNAQESVEVVIPDGVFNGNNQLGLAKVTLNVTYMVGCLTATNRICSATAISGNGGWQISGNNVTASSMPFFTGQTVLTAYVREGGVGGTTQSGEKDFAGTSVIEFRLSYSGTISDSYRINLNVSGPINHDGSANPITHVGSADVVVWLKPGGPASGKIRGPLVPGDEEDPGELFELFSYIPNYTDEGNLSTPQGISLGTRSGTLPVGASWQRVRVPTGATPSSGMPSWMPGIGRSERAGIGSGDGFFFSPNLPAGSGDPPVTPTFSWQTNTQGTFVSAGSPGNTLDVAFPPGHNPKEIDLRPPYEPPTSDNVDPCFQPGLDLLGIFPSDPEDPGTGEPPPGTLPELEVPPIQPVGPGEISPGVTLPGGGGGGGGGTIDLPGGGGGGGGGITLPPADPPEGQAPPEPGLGLPDDNSPQAHADNLATRWSSAVQGVQDALSNLMGKGTVAPFDPGQSSTWTIALQISGHSYDVNVPVQHAPAIRSMLLLLLTGLFLVSVYKLIFA